MIVRTVYRVTEGPGYLSEAKSGRAEPLFRVEKIENFDPYTKVEVGDYVAGLYLELTVGKSLHLTGLLEQRLVHINRLLDCFTTTEVLSIEP